jgi:hypothetical protein
MAGLLDFIQTPEGQGLLSAAFGGLASARRGGGPLNTIGAAGLAGINGYSGAQDQQQRLKSTSLANTVTQMQVDQMKRQQDQQNYIEQVAQNAYKPAMTADQNAMGAVAKMGGQVGPTVQAANLASSSQATPGGIDSQDLMSGIAAKYPMVALDMAQKAKQAGRVTLKKDEVVYDDTTGKPIYNNVQPDIKNGYIVSDGKGGYKVDPALYQAKVQLEATGAPKVNVSPVVKVGQSFGEDVAKAGASQMMGMIDAARSAPQAVDNANQILSALDTGKVMAGPGTKWKIAAAQMFGGNQDSLNATRATIQGLAKMSLSSRKSLSGQGDISDSETALLKRAESGDIDDMTTGEIRLIVNIAKKNAQYVYDQGRAASDALSRMPEVQSILPAFRLPEMPAQQPQPTQPTQPTQQVNMPKRSAISIDGYSAVRK